MPHVRQAERSDQCNDGECWYLHPKHLLSTEQPISSGLRACGLSGTIQEWPKIQTRHSDRREDGELLGPGSLTVENDKPLHISGRYTPDISEHMQGDAPKTLPSAAKASLGTPLSYLRCPTSCLWRVWCRSDSRTHFNRQPPSQGAVACQTRRKLCADRLETCR